MVEQELAFSASPAAPGDPLVRVLRATLRNRSGQGIPGMPVRFLLDGAGSLSPRRTAMSAVAITDTDGFAWARWRAGAAAGGDAIEARVVASADVDDAQLALDHFHHRIAIGPYAPAAP